MLLKRENRNVEAFSEGIMLMQFVTVLNELADASLARRDCLTATKCS